MASDIDLAINARARLLGLHSDRQIRLLESDWRMATHFKANGRPRAYSPLGDRWPDLQPTLLRNLQLMGFYEPIGMQRAIVRAFSDGQTIHIDSKLHNVGRTVGSLVAVANSVIKARDCFNSDTSTQDEGPLATLLYPDSKTAEYAYGILGNLLEDTGVRKSLILGSFAERICEGSLPYTVPIGDILCASPGSLATLYEGNMISFKNLRILLMERATRALQDLQPAEYKYVVQAIELERKNIDTSHSLQSIDIETPQNNCNGSQSGFSWIRYGVEPLEICSMSQCGPGLKNEYEFLPRSSNMTDDAIEAIGHWRFQVNRADAHLLLFTATRQQARDLYLDLINVLSDRGFPEGNIRKSIGLLETDLNGKPSLLMETQSQDRSMPDRLVDPFSRKIIVAAPTAVNLDEGEPLVGDVAVLQLPCVVDKEGRDLHTMWYALASHSGRAGHYGRVRTYVDVQNKKERFAIGQIGQMLSWTQIGGTPDSLKYLIEDAAAYEVQQQSTQADLSGTPHRVHEVCCPWRFLGREQAVFT